MSNQSAINFERIRKAIEFLSDNFSTQPSLEDIAAHINLSPSHFQRMFTAWVGISPKQFLQYTTVGYAKSLLNNCNKSLLFVTEDLGLSSPSRLHDAFIQIEAMTPNEYRNGGENLNIRYQFADSLFGLLLLASTNRGICALQFADNKETALESLREKYPKASFVEDRSYDKYQNQAILLLSGEKVDLENIKLHIKGTEFQIKVWEALLKIPFSNLVSYKGLASSIGMPKASRAVGTAIGDNPVAFLIPCHRVIQSSGALGGYRWDIIRKKLIIGWEQAAESH